MLSTFDRLLGEATGVKDSIRRKTVDGVAYGVKLIRPASGYTTADLLAAAAHGVQPSRKAAVGSASWNRAAEIATGARAGDMMRELIDGADVSEEEAAALAEEYRKLQAEVAENRELYAKLTPEQRSAVDDSGKLVGEWLAESGQTAGVNPPAPEPETAPESNGSGKRGRKN